MECSLVHVLGIVHGKCYCVCIIDTFSQRLNLILIFIQRSFQPSPVRMKIDNPQIRRHEHKDNSRSCTPSSQQGVLRMDGSACRVRQYSGLTEPWMRRACREEKGVGWEDSITSLRDWKKRKVLVTRFLFVMSVLTKSRLVSLPDEKGCMAAKLVFMVKYTNTNDRRIWILMMQHQAPDQVTVEGLLLPIVLTRF